MHYLGSGTESLAKSWGELKCASNGEKAAKAGITSRRTQKAALFRVSMSHTPDIPGIRTGIKHAEKGFSKIHIAKRPGKLFFPTSKTGHTQLYDCLPFRPSLLLNCSGRRTKCSSTLGAFEGGNGVGARIHLNTSHNNYKMLWGLRARPVKCLACSKIS